MGECYLQRKMAVIDPVFLPLTEAGVKFRVWRIQKLQLVQVAEADWGKFYSGDCYLVFDGRYAGDHIYYWIGRDSSQDEQAVAAIKAVELDNLFSGQPVQHREVMGNESEAFRKLFQGGVICLVGGVEGGLRQVTLTSQQSARLFQVGGGKVPILRQVELDWANINHGDTFVLDAGKLIFIWSGESSSGSERLAAAALANKLRDRVGEDIVHLTDGQEEDLDEDELAVWSKHLPLEKRDLVTPADNDRRLSTIVKEEICLYRCSDITGNLTTTLVHSGNLQQEQLDSDDAFIIDAANLGIWIWLGRRSNNNERSMAINTGLKFIEEKKLSKNTRITKVFMGGEPEEFKSLFMEWI